MRSNLFYSFVSLIFICCMALSGVGLYLLYKSPLLLDGLFFRLKAEPSLLLKFSVSVLSFSTFLFLSFYLFTKKTVYHLVLEKGLKVTVEDKILEKFLNDFFEREVASYKIPFELKASGKRMEIVADFSKIPLAEHEELIEGIEPKLMDALERQLGGPSRLSLSVLCQKA